MKRLLCLLLTMCMLFNFAACNTAGSGQQEKENDTVETQTRIFTDSCGREVELPETITSYVPSGPLAQIILFAIAPEEMSGLAAKWYDSAKGIVDDKYLNLPYFGQLYGSAEHIGRMGSRSGSRRPGGGASHQHRIRRPRL